MNATFAHAGPDITLREVTAGNLDQILSLSVTAEQQNYVASNAKSIAQAQVHQEAWFRAIYADATPVGFLMLHDEHLRDEIRQQGYYFLWRLMIDARFQSQGYGRRAVELLIRHVKQRPHAKALLTSFHEGPDSPEGFYAKLGFRRNGNMQDLEVEMELRF